MKNFQDKVVAITGAGSGIGRALALDFAERGCRSLALADIDAGRLADTVRRVEALGARATAATLSVANRSAVFEWAERCRSEHGKVNLIVNNAGVTLISLAESTRPADFEWLMAINFWGVVHGTQAFLPHLRASGEGHVVNISSIFGMAAWPMQSAYNASKFAVRGYTEALRMELEIEGAPVSATCVHPGGIATNIALASRVDPDAQRVSGLDPRALQQRAHEAIQVNTPEVAARQIIEGVERNARRVLVGADARWMDRLTRLLGAGYQALLVRRARRMRQEAAVGASATAAQ